MHKLVTDKHFKAKTLKNIKHHTQIQTQHTKRQNKQELCANS